MPAEFNLQRELAALEKVAHQVGQEDTLRQRFVEALDRFIQVKDIAKKQVRVVLSERLIKGRPDARLGAILFELKLPPPQGDGIEAAIPQLRDYIAEFNRRSTGKLARGIACDGLTLAFLNEKGEVLETGRPTKLTDKLESWLIGLSGQVVDPDDFVNRLGPASPLAQEIVSQLWDSFSSFRKKIGFVDEAFVVWQSLYGAATNLTEDGISALRQRARQQRIPLAGKRDVEEYLFSIQTYLAIILKLLVVRVAVQKRLTPYGSVAELLRQPSPISTMQDLERSVPRISRVFEEDVFLWPAEIALQNRDIEKSLDDNILAISDNLDDVDLVGVSSDFLRLVYQRFLDPVTRRTLGEFYTSPELVNETLDAVGYAGEINKRIADITCGSGTFLMKAIERKTHNNHNNPALLNDITSNVIGIDIHPFAVAMARVNYILGIAELLPSQAPTPVPIYWADSLMAMASTKSPRMANMKQLVKGEIPGLGKFTLPDPDDVDWQDLLQRTRDAIRPLRGVVDAEVVWKRFWQNVPQDKYLPYEETVKKFVTQIVDRHNQNRDMRWLPLLRNTLVTRELSHSCDFVVGNPPWVRIHNISPAIRERLFETYELFMGAGWKRGAKLGKGSRGFARQTDYSLAFVERAMDMLKPGGRLGFVITSKVVYALYGNAFRKKLLAETRLLNLVDYSLHAIPLFEDATNYPLILAFEMKEPPADEQTGIRVVGPGARKLEFSVNQKDLPLLTYDRESPWLLVPPAVLKAFRAMQSYRGNLRPMLGEIPLSQPQRGVVTSLNDVFIVKRIEVVPESSNEVIIYAEGFYNNKLPEKERALYRARVEKTLLRPLVRGENIESWHCKLQDYLLWTHDDTGKVLADLPPKTKTYFMKFRDKLIKRTDYRKNMPIWQIFRVGPEKLGHKVSWCELSNRLEAVFLSSHNEDSLLGKCLTIPIQTAYILPVENESIGYVAAAWLNSLPVRVYVTSYAERARGAYFRHISWVLGLLPVPEAIEGLLKSKDTKDRLLLEMEKLSRQLHSSPSKSDKQATEERIDSIVCELYRISAEDVRAIREYAEFLSGIVPPNTVEPTTETDDEEP